MGKRKLGQEGPLVCKTKSAKKPTGAFSFFKDIDSSRASSLLLKN
jgi:hypothetical protein